MKRIGHTLSVVLIVILFMALPSQAEEAPPVRMYSGDFLTRSTLTGDWGGVRNDWAKKGFTFDMDLTQTAMSVVSGGNHHGWEYSGRGSLTLNFDTQKMGLWPGGHLIVEVEGNYNRSINLDAGALSPVNTNQIFPMAGKHEVNIPAVTYMQFLSHNFGVVLGKMDTTAGDDNEFAHGKGDKQFMNIAFNINPTILLASTNSVLGAGVIILPTKNPHEAIIKILAVDANGVANRSGFDTAFEGNTSYFIEGRMKTDFFGKTGHQLLGAFYSTKNFISLEQNTLLMLEGIIKNGTPTIAKEDSAWAVYYNFDQYLYEPKKGQGVGIFGRFAASDGKANPIHYFYSFGVGGKGVMNSRPNDAFGIGFYYMDVAHPKLIGHNNDRELLRDEYGVEAYYNFAITPWLKLTPDIQFIRPAQINRLEVVSVHPPVIRKDSVDSATVLGLRLQMIF